MASTIFRRGRTTVVLAMLVAIAGPHAIAAEDPREAARSLQSDGLRLLDAGQALPALDRFERAYALVPSPKILFNLGKARLVLGHEVEAFEAFDRFLSEAKDVPEESRDAAKRHRDELRPRIALLNLEGERGGTVWLDGRQIGTTPLPRPIATKPGRHDLRVERDGQVVFVRTVTLQPGLPSYVLLGGPPNAPVAAVPAGTTSDDPGQAGLVGRGTLPALQVETSASTGTAIARSSWRRPVAWTLAGGATVALGLGIWRGATAYDGFNDHQLAGGGSCNRRLENAGGDPCPRLLEDGDANRRIAIVGYAAGAGLAVASAVLWWLEASADGPRVACAVDVVAIGGRCGVRF